jgi:hypothetical protein
MTRWSRNSVDSVCDVREGVRPLDLTPLLRRGPRERRDWGALVVSLLIFSVLGMILGSSCEARAQNLSECAPDYQGTRRVQLEHEGQPGFWFAMPVTRCILRYVLKLETLQVRVGLLEQRLTIRDEQVGLLREALSLSIDAEERALGALEAAERRRREAEERLDAWWRSPYLWVGVGIVVGVGTVVLSVQVLEAT